MAASTSQPGQPLPDRGDLVEMLLIHQRNLHTFLLTLLPHEDDVDDLLQQICLALWQKKDSYVPDRPFLPWAYAFARNHALKYLQQQSRDKQVAVFHGGLLEQLAVARETFDASADTRRQALAACLKQLQPEQRQLLEDRFAGTQTLKQLAAATGVSAASLTMKLQRLRHALLKCVQHRLAREEAT
jgi:RNA polymerase sigma-70 factor (ECF subfamily)